MANTTRCKKNKRERRKAIGDMLAISKAVYMLSDSYLYQIPSAKDINKKNKQWLKKIKTKSHMTKKEYRRWKNAIKRCGITDEEWGVILDGIPWTEMHYQQGKSENPLKDIHPKEIPTQRTEYKYKRKK